MKTILSNIVSIFWGVIFGEILAFFTHDLYGYPYNFLQVAILSAVVVFIGLNGIYFISKDL